MSYLGADELADLIGCKPNSYACMRRWLDKHGWPYAHTITGFPKVSRQYHDARMSGTPIAKNEPVVEPDFGALAA